MKDKKTTIIWGAYQSFDKKIDNLIKKGIEIDFVYPGDYPTSVDLRNIKMIQKEEIEQQKNPYVIISFAKEKDILSVIDFCQKRKIEYVYIDMLIDEKITSKSIKILGGKYKDKNGNSICISSQASDKIFFDLKRSKNCSIVIGNVSVSEKLNIKMLGAGGKIFLDDNTTIFQMNIIVNREGTVKIGKDCMISHHVELQQSDQHMIFDLYTGKRINYPKDILVGNHVWLGRECQLLGGANIGDNSICGARTVTSGKFPCNVIVAGTPGKIIRTGIIWARDLIENSNCDYFEQCSDKKALDYIPDTIKFREKH